MSTEKYRALIEDLCKQAGIAFSDATCRACNIGIHGTSFTLKHGGDLAPDSILIYADFGILPLQAREAVLLRLLEVNLFIYCGDGNPVFAYNPDTGAVVLSASLPLHAASAMSVMQTMTAFAVMSARWSKNYFLSENEIKSGTLAAKRARGTFVAGKPFSR